MKEALIQIGKGSCRGDKWSIENHMIVDFDKIERVWKAIDEGDDSPEELELNDVEESILYGDGEFMDDGFVKCIDRIGALKAGFVICVEGEEVSWCIGKRNTKVEEEFAKFEKEMYGVN